MQRMSFDKIDWDQLHRHCTEGGLIAYPTEGLWGLGGLASHPDLPKRLETLKGKTTTRGIITLMDDTKTVEDWIEDKASLNPYQANWPKHTTLIFPASSRAPQGIVHKGKIALRLPYHCLTHLLCQKLGPLLSTSANQTGKAPAKSADEVEALFGDVAMIVIDGPVGQETKASRIVDVQSGKVLRA